MKQKLFLQIFIVFATVIVCISCSENKSNRVYFTINPQNRQIVIPVYLNDSTKANLTFDTGFYEGAFILDSMFLASHPDIKFDAVPDSSQTGSGWGYNRVLNLKYTTRQQVKIGNTELTYTAVNIANWKGAMYDDNTEGLFNIPQNDTTHVWELNFEYNYLEIHSATNFQIPENCFLVSMEIKGNEGYSNPFFVQIPMQIQCMNGDTLNVNRTYMIDTGMAWDVVLKDTEDLEFFNKQDNDAVWTVYLDKYYRHYTVNATLFDNFNIDSLRIYRFDSLYSMGHNLIGQNFLKRFNVFFDIKNRQMGLQPIKNFQRVVDPLFRRFHILTNKTADGKAIIETLANYKNNYYITAGLKEGDEIIAVNGKIFKDITPEDRVGFYERDTLLFDIIRNGKPMQIVVRVDKTEEQGD